MRALDNTAQPFFEGLAIRKSGQLVMRGVIGEFLSQTVRVIDVLTGHD